MNPKPYNGVYLSWGELRNNLNKLLGNFLNQCCMTYVALQSNLSPKKCLESVESECREVRLCCLLADPSRKGSTGGG